jgi:uncharacterized protein DUF1566
MDFFRTKTAAAAATAGKMPEIGDKMPDGTIYAGVSPDTGKAMYATPADAPLTSTFNQALGHAARLAAHGHDDWRVPTRGELNVLFSNRAAIGGFNERAARYWSSTEFDFDAWAMRFSDGNQGWRYTFKNSSLRCVR